MFLDLDGTLLEIAATPELVVVPPALPGLLAHLHGQLDGAVAIVSGRPLYQIDSLLAPFHPAAAGEHGVCLRFGDGTLEELPVGIAIPEDWRAALTRGIEPWPGVRIETKPHGLAVHYRLAPEREAEVWELVRSLVPPDHPWFRLIPAR
ncbi:MAG TPA: trehalose-phosphatase, partial [Reyranella sp.]